MRQKNLQTQYHFACQCVACKENYPAYLNLPRADIPEGVALSTIQRLQQYSKDFCGEELSKFMAFLSEHDDHYPCVQLSGVQECLKMCLQVKMRNVPMALLPIRGGS